MTNSAGPERPLFPGHSHPPRELIEASRASEQACPHPSRQPLPPINGTLLRPAPEARRSFSALLAPLEALASDSVHFVAQPGATFQCEGERYTLPRYLFVGPKGGGDPIRLGLFAGLHGDEPEGPRALVQFARLLAQSPEIARGYLLFFYPVCNPTGYEDNTRCSRGGPDLNREFWRKSSEPEVALLERELSTHAFHGLIALHSDDTSEGLYGFVRGATLTQHLLQPALAAAAEILPRNENPIIDGFSAEQGIIRQGYPGILSAPAQLRPHPFEIILETPQAAPPLLQERALVVALRQILSGYRQLISYAADL